MRKLFLFAAATAAMLSSCSEELEVVDNKPQDELAVRPNLGAVTFTTGGDLTRAALKQGSLASWQYELDDQLGVSIFDRANYTSKNQYDGLATWDAKYTIVNYISTNYPYTKSASGEWLSPAQLVEGNYLMYFPFNPNMLLRHALLTELPLIQDATGDGSAVDNMLNSGKPFAVGYAKLEAVTEEPLEIKAEMYPIYALPKFTVKNNLKGGNILKNKTDYLGKVTGHETAASSNKINTTGGITVGAIILDSIQVYVGSALPAIAALDHTAVVDKLTKTNTNSWDKLKFESAPTADILALTNPDNKKAADVRGADVVITPFGVDDTDKEYITIRVDKEIETGKDFSFAGILPAMTIPAGKMKARVFLTVEGHSYMATIGTNVSDAMSWVFVDKEHGSDTDAITLLRNQQYPAAEIYSDGSDAKEFKGSLLTINLTNQNLYEMNTEGTATYAGIKDNAGLLAEVDKYDRYQDLKEVPQGATLEAKQFKIQPTNTIIINGDLIDGLYARNYNSVAGAVQGSLTISSVVNIASDVTAEVLEASSGKVKFTSLTSGKDYTFILTNLKENTTDVDEAGYYYYSNATSASVSYTENGYIHVINDNDVTFDGTIEKVSSFVNNGSLTITDAASNTGLVIVNNDEITIEDGVLLNVGINNQEGSAINNNGIMFASNNINNGEITVGKKSAVTKVASGEGVIDNTKLGQVNVNAGQTVVWKGLTSGLESITGTHLGINKIVYKNTTFSLPSFPDALTAPIEGCNVTEIEFLNTVSTFNVGAESMDLNGITIIFDNNVTITGSVLDMPKFTNASILVATGKTVTVAGAEFEVTMPEVAGYEGTFEAADATGKVTVL